MAMRKVSSHASEKYFKTTVEDIVLLGC